MRQANMHIAQLIRMPIRIHFLGAIVINIASVQGRSVARADVIDGQQRLTTLQLFMAALRDVAKAHDADPDDIDTFTRHTENPIRDKTSEGIFKVWPTNADPRQPSVRLCGPAPSVRSSSASGRRPIYRKSPQRTPTSPMRSRTTSPKSHPRMGAKTTQIFALRRALQGSLQLVVIELEPGDDPQMIFETLNARGSPCRPTSSATSYSCEPRTTRKRRASCSTPPCRRGCRRSTPARCILYCFTWLDRGRGASSEGSEPDRRRFRVLPRPALRRGMTPKNYNRFFLPLLIKANQAVAHGDDLAETMRAELLRSVEPTSIWPDDAAFRRGWLANPVYVGSRSDRSAMLLNALNAAMITTKNEKVVLMGLTVEHLLPQNGRIEDYPYAPLPKDAEDVSPEARRKRLLHTVGNLTLLTGPLNSSIKTVRSRRKERRLSKTAICVSTRGCAQTRARPGVRQTFCSAAPICSNAQRGSGPSPAGQSLPSTRWQRHLAELTA